MCKEKEIIEILKEDALVSHATIARLLNISEEEVSETVASLTEKGIIVGYSANINTEKLEDDGPAEAIIGIKVEPKFDFGYDDIAKKIYSFAEVKALYLLSGRYDLAIRVETKTMKDISKFVWEKVAVMESVKSTETLFVMRKYKENGFVFDHNDNQDRLVVTP